MKIINTTVIAGSLLIASLFFVKPVNAAYQVEKLPDTTVYKDFVIGPGKLQLNLKPGESKTVNVTVTNRLGSTKDFQIQLEDFTGSRDVAQPVILIDEGRGPYSLKDYLDIASSTFSIDHATRVTIPVTVRIPADAQPGGLYGSVVISTVSARTPDADTADTAGKSPIVTRIGTLLFIRVAGDVVEDGALTGFSLPNDATLISGEEEIVFRLLYENNGTVHENPYGTITVKNMLGSTVGTIDVEPWFALPDSLRLREVIWNPTFLFGRYTATAEINRGYGNITDTLSLSFWAVPWRIILAVFAVLVVIVFFIKWIFSKFTIARKK